MADALVERIQREAGVPGLLDALAERLTPTDLQSLLLEVERSAPNVTWRARGTGGADAVRHQWL